MVMDYIARSKDYSYFKIANLDGMRKEITERNEANNKQQGGSSVTPSKFGINEDQFNFFMNRQMYK